MYLEKYIYLGLVTIPQMLKPRGNLIHHHTPHFSRVQQHSGLRRETKLQGFSIRWAAVTQGPVKGDFQSSSPESDLELEQADTLLLNAPL